MDDPTIKIAIPKPDSDGSHVVSASVEELVTEDHHPENGSAMVIVGDLGGVLTPEQCFNLSDTFNTAGEVLRRYHE
jgi:hypothetical protein